jgi:zinc transporter ZupT
MTVILDVFYWALLTFLTPLVMTFLPLFRIQISERVLHLMLGLSAGILGGVTFVQVLPEAISIAEELALSRMYVPAGVGIGFLLLLTAERYLLAGEESHGGQFHIHEKAVLDPRHGKVAVSALAFHGFMDGFVIPLAFSAGTAVGLTITVAVVIHQIPDAFAALSLALGSTASRKRAFLYVFATAADTPLGIIVGAVLVGLGSFMIPLGLGVTAGSFVYVSASDLVPELQHKARSPLVVVSMAVGFGLIMALSALLPSV